MIMCRDPIQSRYIYKAFHGKLMKVGTEWIKLDVSSDCLDGDPDLIASAAAVLPTSGEI